jgi:quinolinate synthase
VKIVESLGSDRVICLPDRYLARYIAGQTRVEVIAWEGSCEVHERFTADELRDYRRQFGGDIVIVAHPECPEDVLAEADFVGSTAKMIDYVGSERPGRVLLVTECSMSDNVAAEYPEIEFVRPCNLCPHMKRITLPNILEALETLEPRVEIDPALIAPARAAVERMLAVK